MNRYDETLIDTLLREKLQAQAPYIRKKLATSIHRLSLKRGLTYQKKPGISEPIRLVPVPAVLPRSQVNYLAKLCREIISIVKKIIPLYLTAPRISEIVPLLPWEQRWLKDCWHPRHQKGQPIVYRLDASLNLASPEAARSALFFESNSVAVGGMFYAPVAESILCDTSLRTFYPHPSACPLVRNQDTRLIVLHKLVAHARAMGIRTPTIAVIEDKQWNTGITEFKPIVAFFKRQGIRAYFVDPREITIRSGAPCYRGKAIDVAYRNSELRDLPALEEEGVDLAALRLLFRQNRVVSSLSGEFDHKSLWEVLSSERFERLFTARQKRFLSRHIPWTRLVFERRTTAANGKRVDLIKYMLRRREKLVIKPNRHCGGVGVHIGMHTGGRQWEKIVAGALKTPREWVVQERIAVKHKLLPRFRGRGGMQNVPMYSTYGIISTPHGFGIVGRASTHPVVNVGRGGALLSVMKVRR
jgi:hypothetical protein